MGPSLCSRYTKPLFLGSSFTEILLLSDSSSVSLHPNRVHQHPPLCHSSCLLWNVKPSFLSELVALFNTCLALEALFHWILHFVKHSWQYNLSVAFWFESVWLFGFVVLLMAPKKANSKPLECCWFRPKCIRGCQELICLHMGLTLRYPRNTAAAAASS